MSEVIESVRTPLALAALVLLLGAQLLRQILRRNRRPDENTKAIIRYAFILGLVFGVLAIGSYMYSATIDREIRISGSIVNEDGTGIPGAKIRISGRGNGVTDGEGDFGFTIPASRAATEYIAEVSAKDYEMSKVPLIGRNPQPFTAVLKKQAVSIENSIALPAQMTVLHWLGVPEIGVSLTFTNPFPDTVKVTDISVVLTTPSGSSVPMIMNAVSPAPGQPLEPPLRILSLNRGDQLTLMYDFFNGDASFVLLQGKVFKEAAPTQAAHPYPDPKVNILSTDLAKELRDYMDSHFIWEAGTWKIMASCQIQGRETNATATFVLSASDVQTMKNISKYYATGIGVGSNWRNLPTDDANPIKMVQLAQLKN